MALVFVWMFILFAGGMLLTIFFMIASGQANAAQERLERNALEQVNTILSAQQASPDSSLATNIPQTNIRLTCEAIREGNTVLLLSQLQIGSYTRSLETELVAGRDMETGRLILFSKGIQTPFTIGNVLLVTNPQELLVVPTNNLAAQNRQRFLDAIPQEIQDERLVVEVIPDNTRTFSTIRHVTMGNSAPVSITARPGVQYIHVRYENNILERGEISFFEEGEWRGGYHYVGEGMLFALLWQAETARANCMQHKLTTAIQRQAFIQELRMSFLTQSYLASQSDSSCTDNYLVNRMENLRTSMTLDSSAVALYDFSELYARVSAVRELNERLLRGDRCASIY